jgi:hypothetical protein
MSLDQVIMFSGKIKPIKDLKIGDQLMGDDNTPRNIINVYKSHGPLYKIKQINGEEYIVNENHILSLKLSYIGWKPQHRKQNKYKTINNKKYQKGEVVDINVEDYIKLTHNHKKTLKGYKSIINFPAKELPIDPYIIGLWLGDGTSITSCITNQDSAILHYLVHKLPEYNCYLQYHHRFYYRINGVKKYDNYIMQQLRILNLIDNKHIPDIYKYNSRENQLKLLAGLLDTDGSYLRNCYDIIQKNYILAKDIEFVARCLGFSCKIVACKKSCMYKGTKRENTYYRQNICGAGLEEIPCLIPRKKAGVRKQIKNVLHTGITVEPLNNNTREYYKIETDGNGRFILGDHTVTHT